MRAYEHMSKEELLRLRDRTLNDIEELTSLLDRWQTELGQINFELIERLKEC